MKGKLHLKQSVTQTKIRHYYFYLLSLSNEKSSETDFFYSFQEAKTRA